MRDVGTPCEFFVLISSLPSCRPYLQNVKFVIVYLEIDRLDVLIAVDASKV